MKVKEFIEWLSSQDQNATVQVMVQQKPTGYDSFGDCSPETFDPEEFMAEVDVANNETFLILGKKW